MAVHPRRPVMIVAEAMGAAPVPIAVAVLMACMVAIMATIMMAVPVRPVMMSPIAVPTGIVPVPVVRPAPMATVEAPAAEAAGGVETAAVETATSPRQGVGRKRQRADQAGNGGSDACAAQHARPRCCRACFRGSTLEAMLIILQIGSVRQSNRPRWLSRPDGGEGASVFGRQFSTRESARWRDKHPHCGTSEAPNGRTMFLRTPR